MKKPYIDSYVTERLIAEKVHASDLAKFRIMHCNQEVMRTLGGLRTEKKRWKI